MGRLLIIFFCIFFISYGFSQSSNLVIGDCISVQAVYRKGEKIGQFSIWIRSEKKLECLDSMFNQQNTEFSNELAMYYNFNAIDDIKIFVNGELVKGKIYQYEKSITEFPRMDRQGVFFEYKDKIKTLEVVYFDKYLEKKPINLKLL